jgi:hypothetical protein
LTAARVSALLLEKSNACGFCGRCGQARHTRETHKKRADVRGCGSRVRRLWQGKGLRLPFLCMHVIGGCAAEVEPHPSEPFE